MPERVLKLEIAKNESGKLELRLTGHLSSRTAGPIWQEATPLLETAKPRELVLDVSALEYCDITGIGFFQELKTLQESSRAVFHLVGLRADQQNLFDLVSRRSGQKVSPQVLPRISPVEALGRHVAEFCEDLYGQVAFVGEAMSQLLRAALHPRSIRWKDVWVFIEKGGVNAMPLIMMAGFLIGVIMAFQSALPLKQMGSDVFVANVVAFAVLRELGPLITAIILAGRTGSAIAAEIGTMKINEEVNALTTMGLEPVRFLVVSRMIGIIFLAPLLTVISDFFGMLGGALVFQSFGYSMTTYLNQITSTVDLSDILGGIFKAIPFSLAVGGIGCLRGLQTKTGASAVGESTTSAVVTGMVLIIILDGLISAIYFVLGI
ncbi:MAG TPA: MlaE family lipid ABC transporter permease subunit [Candidatus Omnitrophota bacterium]|nr:MlaE family lipid ABC transporter permease subunit [Candidatus Omnitrophota bacterium]HPS37590.1 MlaE family lipid ABC transporter permease subunit [Candidatus Omnitrophota bacterium]